MRVVGRLALGRFGVQVVDDQFSAGFQRVVNGLKKTFIADAEIDYDGRGFVSRSAKPGLVNRIFSFLGLG